MYTIILTTEDAPRKPFLEFCRTAIILYLLRPIFSLRLLKLKGSRTIELLSSKRPFFYEYDSLKLHAPKLGGNYPRFELSFQFFKMEMKACNLM